MIIELVRDYFLHLGVDGRELSFLKEANFSNACIFKLPNVCIIAKNRTTPSHQSHIHVTGGRMKVFFTTMEIARNQEIPYTNQNIILSSLNISSINGRQVNNSKIGLIKTVMRKKLALRRDFSVQVQLGERLADSDEFNSLREGLYKDDYFVALRYLHGDKLLILGIPNRFVEGNIEPSVYEEYNMALPVMEPDSGTEENVDGSDAIYQSEIQQEIEDSRRPIRYNNEPSPYGNRTPTSRESHRASTDPRLGKLAMERNNFKCAFDSSDNPHETFIAISGKPYLEAHHLIPMANQIYFSNKLDVISNIVPLCPTCHRKIHNGRPDDRKAMISRLYEERKNELQHGIGRELSLEELLNLNDIE